MDRVEHHDGMSRFLQIQFANLFVVKNGLLRSNLRANINVAIFAIFCASRLSISLALV